jgi:hypothetical protein
MLFWSFIRQPTQNWREVDSLIDSELLNLEAPSNVCWFLTRFISQLRGLQIGTGVRVCTERSLCCEQQTSCLLAPACSRGV